MPAQIVRWAWLGFVIVAFAGGLRPLYAAEDAPAADPTENTQEHGTDAGESGHASAAHDPEDILHANAGPMQEDPSEIRGSLSLWTLVVFGLLMCILWKFAWGPITEALDRREAGILANIESAKKQN